MNIFEELTVEQSRPFWHAEEQLGRYFEFYCEERVHQALEYRTPSAVYHVKGSRECRGRVEEINEFCGAQASRMDVHPHGL